VTVLLVLSAAIAAVRPASLTALPSAAAPAAAFADMQVSPAYVPPSGAAGEEAIALRPLRALASPAYPTFHTLAEGETLGDVAARYGVTAETLFWANGLGQSVFLPAGRELRVPRVSGVPHTVQAGETIESIAAQYGVPPEALVLVAANGLRAGEAPPAGREIFVPGGSTPLPEGVAAADGGVAGLRAVLAGAVREAETNLRAGPGRAYERVAELDADYLLEPIARHDDWVKVGAGELGEGWVRADLIWLAPGALEALPETNDFPPPPPRWVWPSYGELTSPFGWRSVPFRSFHNGLDIANAAGTPIFAARTGRVTEAGWCRGYGYCVRIDHGEGVMTIYGHLLKKPRVARGDTVEAGDRIGLMGSTYDRAGGGYSTGVHLHFTVTVNGRPVNPLKFLP
jgi:murein DD-endopeptidase MepM/ murein hydrolase activator NlpD